MKELQAFENNDFQEILNGLNDDIVRIRNEITGIIQKENQLPGIPSNPQKPLSIGQNLEPNNIYLMNFMEGLKQIEDNSIDLIITDPPYNISQKGRKLERNFSSPIKYDFGDWDRMDEKSFSDFTKEWFAECARVLKNGGWFFCFFAKEKIGYFTDPLYGLFKRHDIDTRTVITWHKTNPVPSLRKKNFLSSCEFIVAGSKGKSSLPNFLTQKEMHNFFETPNSTMYRETKHPTEKPVKLIKWLIRIASKEGEKVLDPFMGSGTTAVACKQLNRKYLGFENNPEYCKMAEYRLKRVPVRLDNFRQQNRVTIHKTIEGNENKIFSLLQPETVEKNPDKRSRFFKE